MQQTSTEKMPAFFHKDLKTVRDLSVNKTKLTSRETFIHNLFSLKNERKSKKEKGTFLWGSPQSLDMSLNP